ncbi:MAG: hypothetical protein KF812_00515 [Fimbriimonadaceae bacterium]|nr:hypothetical protein [Fimbriimonadaceae bacterium]
MKHLLCLIALGSVTFAFAADPMVPQPLERFDGQTWSGITLGQTRDGDLKAKFPTSGSPVRPEARRIGVTGPFVVDALLDGRGENAVVRALRVEFKEAGPNHRTMSLLYDEDPVTLFAKERYSDWKLIAFPRRGVWLYTVGDEAPRTAFLCSAENLKEVLQATDRKPSTFSEIQDPGDGWDRTVTFSDYYVDVRIENSGRPSACNRGLEYSIESQIERQLERLRGVVRYGSHSRGIIRVTIIGGRWDNQGRATFNASASGEFDTPYGRINESSSTGERISSGFSYRIADLGFTALDQLLRDVRGKINRLRPPTPAEMDERVLQSIYDTITRP